MAEWLEYSEFTIPSWTSINSNPGREKGICEKYYSQMYKTLTHTHTHTHKSQGQRGSMRLRIYMVSGHKRVKRVSRVIQKMVSGQ